VVCVRGYAATHTFFAQLPCSTISVLFYQNGVGLGTI
jgi:hypothetical protein